MRFLVYRSSPVSALSALFLTALALQGAYPPPCRGAADLGLFPAGVVVTLGASLLLVCDLVQHARGRALVLPDTAWLQGLMAFLLLAGLSGAALASQCAWLDARHPLRVTDPFLAFALGSPWQAAGHALQAFGVAGLGLVWLTGRRPR